MAIRHFPAAVRTHVGAIAEAKADSEDQEKQQGFLAHAVGKAEGVLTVAALYERRMTQRAGGHRPPLQKRAHAIDRPKINAVQTAPKQLLRHQINRIVALRRHHLRQRAFILATPRNLEKVPALRGYDSELNTARIYRDLADRVAFALTQLDVDLMII